MPRILFESDISKTIVNMCDGNPGALTVLIEVIKTLKEDVWLILCRLDDAEIYGPDIWLGYKDVCKQDIIRFIDEVKGGTLKAKIHALPYR